MTQWQPGDRPTSTWLPWLGFIGALVFGLACWYGIYLLIGDHLMQIFLYSIAVIAGMFVGWNLPQPEFAKRAQAWVMQKLGR